MATAIETSSQSQASSPPSLLTSSLLGAIYVLAAIAVVLYAVPAIWSQMFGDISAAQDWRPAALLFAVRVAVLVGLAWFGVSLIGSNPAKGLRGGIFLVVALVLLTFFVVCGIGAAVSGAPGQVFTAIVAAAMVFGAFKLLTSARGERWMIALEDQGWFSGKSYKRVLGLKVRRITILGILLLLGSGIYTLIAQGSIPDNWTIQLPFTQQGEDGASKVFTLLTDAKYALPAFMIALGVWFAYRAVNVPTFAEFLIATEAEMNKVSWTNRKRLTQDTIVVLATTILMALFLLVVDLFWGWLLSTSVVGVLPPKSTDKQGKAGMVQEAKW